MPCSGRIESASIITATQFADILGVSRTPVREALLQLAGEGFLDAINGRGFRMKEFSGKEIRDFFETRTIIECHVVSQLVGSLNESDFSLLDETVVSIANPERNEGSSFPERSVIRENLPETWDWRVPSPRDDYSWTWPLPTVRYTTS